MESLKKYFWKIFSKNTKNSWYVGHKFLLFLGLQQSKQVFQSLRKHEVVGIHIKMEWYKRNPIVESPLPSEYLEQEHVIKCANYPNSNEVDDFDPFLSTLDSTL